MAVVQTRDVEGLSQDCGGDPVTAEVISERGSSVATSVTGLQSNILDQTIFNKILQARPGLLSEPYLSCSSDLDNGSYEVSFTPPSVGTFCLKIFIFSRPIKADWSTLIGRAPTLLRSHWSRASLVMLAPAILCHKEPARASKAPYY